MSVNNLSSIAIAQKYGITRSDLEYVARTNFTIPNVYREYFESMHLLYWSGEHLINKIRNGMIRTLENDAGYHAIFIDGLTRGQIIGEIANSKEKNIPPFQYGISFRRANCEFNIPALALIRVSKTTIHTIGNTQS